MSLSSLQRSPSRHISRACFETLEERRLLSFSPATSFPVGTNPQAVATADSGDNVVSVLLEGRAVPSTFTVLNLADSGEGSLRQAVLDANALAGADTIHLAPGLTGTIPLTSGVSPQRKCSIGG